MPFNSRNQGFTLAELLISLAILGVIATFTIPKILVTQQNQKHSAIVKEAASMVSGVYSAYKLQNIATSGTSFGDLTPYMNYLRVDNSTTIDTFYGQGSRTCNSVNYGCLKLHNGATLLYASDITSGFFGGTGTTNGIYFIVDPDGSETDGTTNGPGKGTEFWLYYNGKVTSKANTFPQVCNSGNCYVPSGNEDPPYFNW